MNVLIYQTGYRLNAIIDWFSKLLTDIFTGKDNKTFDSGRVWMGVSFAYYYHLAEAAANAGHAWSSTDYASGISIIAVAFSVNIRIKDTTELNPELPTPGAFPPKEHRE